MGFFRHYKSKSYQTAACCAGTECHSWRKSTKKQPCWGSVWAGDEIWDGNDAYTFHFCEGHYECEYTEEKK